MPVQNVESKAECTFTTCPFPTFQKQTLSQDLDVDSEHTLQLKLLVCQVQGRSIFRYPSSSTACQAICLRKGAEQRKVFAGVDEDFPPIPFGLSNILPPNHMRFLRRGHRLKHGTKAYGLICPVSVRIKERPAQGTWRRNDINRIGFALYKP